MQTEKEKEIDIHGRESRIISAYERLNAATIDADSKRLILKFVSDRKTSKHIGQLREAKAINVLRRIAEIYGKPLSDLKPRNRDEEGISEARGRIIELLNALYNRPLMITHPRTNDIYNKGGLSESTKKDYYIFLKMFCAWLVNRKRPEEWETIEPPRPQVKKPKTSELLTPEDIQILCKAATNERDLLLPQLLFDLGGRIEETLTLRLRDLEPVDGGACYVLHLNKSKRDITGQEARRSVIIYNSVPALVNWLNKHPQRNNIDAPLFIGIRKQAQVIDYAQARKILKKLKERSKLNKRVNPHFFRKSATSYLRNKKKMNDASLLTRHGWKPASNMLNIYASPDMQESNEDFMRANGLIKDNMQKEEKEINQACKICGHRNPLGVDYCEVCKRPIRIEDYLRADTIISKGMEERLSRLEEILQNKKTEIKPLYSKPILTK